MNANTIDARGLYYVLRLHNVRPACTAQAAAGRQYGLVSAWELPLGFLLEVGCGGFPDYLIADDADDLCQYLEAPDLSGLDAIVDRANVRGAEVIPAAKPDSDGPFYVLRTRYWYGPREHSELLSDDRGQPLEFARYEYAAASIYAECQGRHVLSDNESERPSYKIISEGDLP